MLKFLLVFLCILLPAGDIAARNLTIPIAAFHRSLNPADVIDIHSAFIHGQIYEGLFELDKTGFPKPVLVKQFSISPNGKTYLFHLNTEKRFSNGSLLTAQIVADSFERTIKKLGTSFQWAVGDLVGFEDFVLGKTKYVTGIKVLGPGILQIKLSSPFFQLLQVLATPYFKVALKNEEEFFGSGPYVITNQNKSLLALKYNKYHGEKPDFSQVLLEKIDSFEDVMNKGLWKNYDIVWTNFNTDVSDSDFNKKETPYLFTLVLSFNLKKEPFQSREIRCHLASLFFQELKEDDTGWIDAQKSISFSWNFFDQMKPNPEKSDIGQTVKWNKPIEIIYGDSVAQFSRKNKKFVEKALQKFGNTKVTMRRLGGQDLLTRLSKGEYDIGLWGYLPDYIDPDAFFYPSLVTNQQYNWSGYTNKKFDRLMQQARKTEKLEQRLQLYKKALQLIGEDCPQSYLGTSKITMIYNKRLQDVPSNPLGIYTFKLKDLKETK